MKGKIVTEKMTQISAIVGAVYIIARVVVLLTPTEADDKWLKKVVKWATRIFWVLGVDMNQGIRKYGPK
jgi:hypothetical protein